MTQQRFRDRAEVGKPRKTVDGYLVAQVHAARTGVQGYLGSEIGRDDLDVVRVYRPEDEIFDRASLGSFKGKPITVGHPVERVTAANHRDLARGHIAGVARDGERVALDVAITDAETVATLESGGPRQLSVGYVADIEFTAGVTDSGERYDAVQRNIFVDHLAIVQAARAGDDFRIRVGDDAEQWGASPISTQDREAKMADLKTVVLGDKAAQVAATDASIIEQYKADQAKAFADAETAHKAAMAEKDKAIADKDKEITDLKAKAMTDADLDARVAARAKVVDAAKRVDPQIVTDGVSDADIRRAVVAKSIGDEDAKAMSDGAIEGAFALAVRDAKPGNAALAGGIKTQDAGGSWDNILPMRKGA